MRDFKTIAVVLLAAVCALAAATARADFNWPVGPPPDSKPPQDSEPKPGPKPDHPPKKGPDKDCGSIIGCEPQTLGEVISLTGTGLRLHYQSERQPGRRAANQLKIRLSGATVPPGLQRIHLEIAIAGQTFEKNFPPQPNLFDTFLWDGKDIYGRTLQGLQPVQVRIGYQYAAQYYATANELAASFNRFGTSPSDVGGVTFSLLPVRSSTPPIILWQAYESSLGSLTSFGLGGWNLSIHHAYDIGNRTLHLGSGGQRSATTLDNIIVTIAGIGFTGCFNNGGPAIQAGIASPYSIAAGPDDSLYIADCNVIRRIAPDGIITVVAGTLGNSGFAGDGGPATLALLSQPQGVAVGSDGSLYIADGRRIRRVGPDGIITTVTGTASGGSTGDGGPAILATLTSSFGISIAPDGSVFFADDQRVRRIGTDGIITTVAGGGPGMLGDGGLATQATLGTPTGIAAAPDGSLYISEQAGHRVRRVGPDGIITTVAGNGIAGSQGDGGPATLARLNQPYGVALGPDGSIYIADFANFRARRVGPTGTINTIAGTGQEGYSGDGGPATGASLETTIAVTVGPDGGVNIADFGNHRIRKVRPPLPGVSVTDFLIASEDGGEIYVFDSDGRHLRTLDALTGAVRFQFAYTGAGRLTGITDGDGNVTTIERDAGNNPSAIVAPFG
ncbi:MAG: hypothetical protein ABI831_14095, partial [Betaproteobacteria bacterium]